MRLAALLTLLSLATLSGASTAATPAPCAAPEHRQFDFWIGDWQVSTPDGKLAGHNRITREYQGCVIHEHYTTNHRYNGESLNIYDPLRKVWHQTWVDDAGLLLILEGKWNGKSMVLQGQSPDDQGVMRAQRVTWTPNTDGSVRQLWESQGDGGVWTILFDGRYVKR
jgi:hypothetical protein